MPRSCAQLEQAAADAEAWLDQLDPDDPDTTVNDPADQAVAAARNNGRVWGDIAMILGISRQAAQKRYGHPATVVPKPR